MAQDSGLQLGISPPGGQWGLMKPQQVRLRLTSLSWGQPWLMEWSVWNISWWLLFPPQLKHSESLLCSSLWEPGRSPGGKNSPKARNALLRPLHRDWASLEFLTLRLVHTEAPGIQFKFSPWQLRFPCPGSGSQEGCGLWVSAPVSHDFLYSPLSVSNLGSSSLSCDLTSAAAAAAKSLQSCLTLCDPIDGSPPGSSIPGILQSRTLDWVAISFSNACMHAKLLQSCLTLCDPMNSSPPGSSVHGILYARILEWVAIAWHC